MHVFQGTARLRGGLIGVQDPAWRSRPRTCSMNGSSRWAALPRTPAIHPVDTAIPASCASSTVERQTGM